MSRTSNQNASLQIHLDAFQKAYLDMNSIYFTGHDQYVTYLNPPGPHQVVNHYDNLIKHNATMLKLKPHTEAYLANPQNGDDIERINTLIAWSRYAETYFAEYDKIQRELYRKHSRVLRNRTRHLIKVRDEQSAKDTLTIANLSNDTLDELSLLKGIADLPSELQDLIGTFLTAQTIEVCIMDYAINTMPLIMTDNITIPRLKLAEEYIRQKRIIQYRTIFANAISDHVILPGMNSQKAHGWESSTHRRKNDYITNIIGQLKVYDYIHNIFIRNNGPSRKYYQVYARALQHEILFTIKYVRFISRLLSFRKRQNRFTEPSITL